MTSEAAAETSTTSDSTLYPIEARVSGGLLALNRFLMTLQNKRVPVAGITVDGDRKATRVTLLLDCPEETARRYTTLLSSLEDVEDVGPVEGGAPARHRAGRPAAKVDYDGRRFEPVENSATGEVGAGTTFLYRQEGDVVRATYEGGGVRFGTFLAKVVDESGRLDARYQHVNESGELMTGECRSTPETLPDGRLRLHETWRWTSGDRSSGRSIVEEMPAGSPPEQRG